MSINTKNFRELHQSENPLVLVNAWDVASARIIENLGAKAIATTSAGVCWSYGYPDGNELPLDLVIMLAKNLVRVVKVPVSIDFEAGYSSNYKQVGENIKALLGCGIAGINIEDGTESPESLAQKIEEIKRVAAMMNLDIFINARTDVYLRNLVSKEHLNEEAIRRARIYSDAGADGLFVPGITDSDSIQHIAQSTKLALNVMAWNGLPTVNQLGSVGVKRVSTGSSLSQLIWDRTEQYAKDFFINGHPGSLLEHPMDFGKLQDLFKN